VTALQPPGVPLFIAGTTGPNMPAAMNSLVRDPFTFLLSPPLFRATRAAALNLTEGINGQFIPWDTVAEDTYSGWTSPAVVGGGGSTTLNGATSVGATSATLTSSTGFAIGNVARFESSGANVEYRVLTNVAGNVISWSSSAPLALAHANGSTVVEVTSDPTRYVVQAPGWYLVDAKVSLSGTGAASLVLIPGISVNFGSHTGFGTLWEGTEHGVPTGASAQPKIGNGLWQVYCNTGDFIQINLFYSTESAITAVDTTAGIVCAVDLSFDGV
jgi:hypothetical protein